jgi:hypothetical protein
MQYFKNPKHTTKRECKKRRGAMADIKKVTFGSLIEEFDPDEKSSPEFDIITGKFPVEDLASFYESGTISWE